MTAGRLRGGGHRGGHGRTRGDGALRPEAAARAAHVCARAVTTHNRLRSMAGWGRPRTFPGRRGLASTARCARVGRVGDAHPLRSSLPKRLLEHAGARTDRARHHRRRSARRRAARRRVVRARSAMCQTASMTSGCWDEAATGRTRLFEPFHEAPSLADVMNCLRKQLALEFSAKGRARWLPRTPRSRRWCGWSPRAARRASCRASRCVGSLGGHAASMRPRPRCDCAWW